MKIVRSLGTSYTEKASGENEEIGRGVRLSERMSFPSISDDVVSSIAPSELDTILNQHLRYILRSLISVLDKVFRKPRTLHRCSIDTYVNRALVSEALWTQFSRKFRTELSRLSELDRRKLREMWEAKVHPYTNEKCNFLFPDQDRNGQRIYQRVKSGSYKGELGKGRLFGALVIKNGEKVSADSTANAIFNHLVSSEKRPLASGDSLHKSMPIGLLEARHRTISASANDPRKLKSNLNISAWGSAAELEYFYNDVAQEISFVLLEDAGSEEGGHSAGLSKAIGKILYDHFSRERLPAAYKGKSDTRAKELWAIHTAVRKFYKDLVTSQRFRRAYASSSELELLAHLIPQDQNALLDRLKARRRNRSLSEYIRLGKLIVHATDIENNVNVKSEEIDGRMDWLATSDGQSYIKRNESFNRCWRQAVGLTYQNVRTLANPQNKFYEQLDKGAGRVNFDPFSSNVAGQLVSKKKFDSVHNQFYMRLMFGGRQFNERHSRAETLVSSEVSENQQMIWAILQIARKIRDVTNHFNTKPHLIAAVKEGLVTWTEIEPETKKSQMRKGVASQGVCRRLIKLLELDNSLLAKVIMDDLAKVKAQNFIPAGRENTLITQLSCLPLGESALVPKFRSTLQRIRRLIEADKETEKDLKALFCHIDLKASGANTDAKNTCKIELLRMLYNSGFKSWLAALGRSTDEGVNIISDAISETIEALHHRKKTYRADEGLSAEFVEVAADGLDFSHVDDFAELMKKLATESAREAGSHKNYDPDRGEQSKRASWMEDFRQEIFARLFAVYLSDNEFEWINNLEETGSPLKLESMSEKLALGTSEAELKPWEASFYVWLYLVPPQTVSLLRQHLIKSRVLERKANEIDELDRKATDANKPAEVDTLDQMDRLMALYLRVHGAGFEGTEHIAKLAAGDQSSDITVDLLKACYQNPDRQRDLVAMHAGDEEGPVNVSGTNRGLRELIRFGHFDVLKSTFEKHKVRDDEVRLLSEQMSKVDFNPVRDANRLHSKLLELKRELATSAAAPKASEIKREIVQTASLYRDATIEATHYNFCANAVRLGSFANLHALLMRIVGRLTDYTLMWERDRLYAFLGMLYHDQISRGEKIQFIRSNEKMSDAFDIGTIGIVASDSMCEKLKKVGTDLEPFANYRFLPIWEPGRGLYNHNFKSLAPLLMDDIDKLKVFVRAFVEVSSECHNVNIKDAEAAEALKRVNRNAKTRPGPLPEKPKKRIRDDFAHYNVITEKIDVKKGDVVSTRRSNVNLNYLVNAVRSLVSYDTKLKKSVSGSVSEILANEGVEIEWRMHQDRFVEADFVPKTLYHLSFLPDDMKDAACFHIPRVSPRYLSMIKALFDFGSSGYVSKSGEIEGCKYPKNFRAEADLLRIPNELMN